MLIHPDDEPLTNIDRNRRPQKCKVCKKQFSRPSQLREHSFSHTRPFKCDQCKKTFTRSAHLKSHKFTHEEEKPFKCELCPKSCCTSTHLKQHMLKHTGKYICDILIYDESPGGYYAK